ncbi:hypothetical protein BT69DRAFT_1293640 [Atractiella rhizophila]|nr:hypothetical protein BT69DRAFT_1293640 [Atractiella rhizophila]
MNCARCDGKRGPLDSEEDGSGVNDNGRKGSAGGELVWWEGQLRTHHFEWICPKQDTVHKTESRDGGAIVREGLGDVLREPGVLQGVVWSCCTCKFWEEGRELGAADCGRCGEVEVTKQTVLIGDAFKKGLAIDVVLILDTAQELEKDGGTWIIGEEHLLIQEISKGQYYGFCGKTTDFTVVFAQ